MTSNPEWPKGIYRALRQADIRQASYVPDAGHGQLIELLHADSEIQTTVLTTEEEGVAQSDFSAMIDVLCDIAGLEKPRLAAPTAPTAA